MIPRYTPVPSSSSDCSDSEGTSSSERYPSPPPLERQYAYHEAYDTSSYDTYHTSSHDDDIVVDMRSWTEFLTNHPTLLDDLSQGGVLLLSEADDELLYTISDDDVTDCDDVPKKK